MLTELQLDHAAFDLWINAEGTDNLVDLERAKRMLPIVLNECITEKQKNYILKYFIEKMSISEIAEFYGVDRSCVSRGIKRGLDKAYGYLRFVSPLFVNAPKKRGYLNNGRKRNGRNNNGLDTP